MDTPTLNKHGLIASFTLLAFRIVTMVAATLKAGSSVRVVQTGKIVRNAVLELEVEATSATVGPCGLSGIVIHVCPRLGAIAVWLLV